MSPKNNNLWAELYIYYLRSPPGVKKLLSKAGDFESDSAEEALSPSKL